MQTLSHQSPNNISQQSRMIAVVAMLVFAMAGLISGFAVGIFVHPGQHIQPTGQTRLTKPPPVKQSTTTTPTPRIQHPLPLGFPLNEHVSYIEMADDNTTYNISTQVTDQSNGAYAPGKPIHAPGITCKLWLTKISTDVKANMPIDRLKAVNTLSQPFPKEEVNALDFFDPSTPQTQMCNGRGRASWSYKVATSVKPGMYFLIVLTDWNGFHWSSSWVQIKIT